MPNAHQQDCIVIFVDMAAPLAVTSTSQEKVNDFAFLFLKRNIIWHILITVIQIIWHISISEDNMVTFARIKTEKKTVWKSYVFWLFLLTFSKYYVYGHHFDLGSQRHYDLTNVVFTDTFVMQKINVYRNGQCSNRHCRGLIDNIFDEISIPYIHKHTKLHKITII